MADIIERLRIESQREPNKPIWRDAIDEIEALRAEVKRLKSMTAVTMGIGSGDGNLFVHGDYDSIKAAQALVFRAERMEKALRLIESAKDRGFSIDYARGVAQSILAAQKQGGRTDG